MDLNSKLSLTLRGYSPTMIGMLTQIINRRIKISEAKIKEILGIPMSESLQITAADGDLLRAASASLLKLFSGQNAPPAQTVAKAVSNLAQQSRINLDPRKVANLASFIIDNWADMAGIHNVMAGQTPEDEVEDERDVALKNSARVPKTKVNNIAAPNAQAVAMNSGSSGSVPY